jgi:protoporphyrinogen oxidase
MSVFAETPARKLRSRPGLRTAVIGGGLLGMQIAKNLRARRAEITLIEAARHLGGLADSWSIGDVTWDRHYHVILMSDLRTRSLLKSLGLEDQLVWKETKTGFYTDDKLVSMSNTLEFLKFPPLGLIDKLRLGGTIFWASKIKNWKKLETIPVVSWLRKWSGKRTTEKVWLPLLRAKLGENYQYASAAFIWAIIARMYAARRSGLKREMFGYVRGGYGRVLEEFGNQIRQMGIDIQLGSKVSAVAREGNGLRISFHDHSHACFDQVIITTPAPAAAKICHELSNEEIAKLKSLRYQGIVCASVVLKKALGPYYVTNITDDWVPFTAVIEMTALVNPSELQGFHLVYLPKYVDPTDPLFEISDTDIQNSFISALQRMYPDFQASDIIAFRVSRVKHVLAISTLNYSQNLPPMTTSIPGLHLVNSAHIVNGTLNVNETLTLADRATDSILQGVHA